jgi:hypothetical protein
MTSGITHLKKERRIQEIGWSMQRNACYERRMEEDDIMK